MTLRLCGCGDDYQGPPHIEPQPDWIGDWSVTHGESETPVPGSGERYGGSGTVPDTYCLCGHPNYLWCPGWFNGEGTVMGMTMQRGGEEG